MSANTETVRRVIPPASVGPSARLARHGGPRTARRKASPLLALLVCGLFSPPPVRAQDPDSSKIHRDATRAQARLERFRETRLPWARPGGGHSCDVRIGRFCFWHDYQDDPWPVLADHPDLVKRRAEFLALLDHAQEVLPGDSWLVGQRIYYRTELGHRDDALANAEACRAESWWCAALEGYVHHVRGEFEEAGRAFETALTLMDEERASRWSSVEDIVSGKVQERLEGKAHPSPEWRTLWRLADPLLLMPGNDRLTAHYARWVLSEIRSQARNPHGISWGDDLTEITVRFGWNRGWMRRRSRFGTTGFPNVAGRSLRKGRDWMPPADVFTDPSALAEGEWVPEAVTPQNHYTPYYAPDLLPSEGQVAVFPRVDSVLVIAAIGMPEAPPERPRPGADSLAPDAIVTWPDLPLSQGPPREGLFLVNARADIVSRHERRGGEGGGLIVRAPAGDYWLSLESWVPTEGRGARLRLGVQADTLEPDVVTLSDLLILVGSAPEFDDPAETLRFVSPTLDLTSGEAFMVGWELNGLGWRDETVQFELALFPSKTGLFSRIGRWFTEGSGDPLRVTWVEVGPASPGPWFRQNRIELSDLDDGEYVIQLRVRLRGREDLSVSRVVRIVSPTGALGGSGGT
jgi:hypothetical protein